MAISTANDTTGYNKDIHGYGADSHTGSSMSELGDSARHTVEKAKDAVKDQYEGIRDSAQHAAASLKDVIVHNPMASLGIAAAAGLLVGLVFTRRS